MTGLQTATDIVAIICMSVITVTWLVFLALAIALRRKINRLFDKIDEIMRVVRSVPFISRRMFSAMMKRR